MKEVFRKYGDGGPHVEPIACVVRHPDAGGQCEREAVGEVWSLPFCEIHAREAELAPVLRHPTPEPFPLRVFGRHCARFWLLRPGFGVKLAPERTFRRELLAKRSSAPPRAPRPTQPPESAPLFVALCLVMPPITRPMILTRAPRGSGASE